MTSESLLMEKKLTFVAFFLLCMYSVSGQTTAIKIKGVVSQETGFKYAYLQDAKRKLLLTTVVNGKFEFEVDRMSDLDLRTLSLSRDSIDRTSFVRDGKFFRARSSRLIAMEDLTIEIGSEWPTANVKGGPRNIEVDEMFQSLQSKDVAHFFQTHPDSQISLILLKSLIRINEISPDFNYPCSAYYDLLTNRLKGTPEGKKVKDLLK
jgi:hypothetical protein